MLPIYKMIGQNVYKSRYLLQHCSSYRNNIIKIVNFPIQPLWSRHQQSDARSQVAVPIKTESPFKHDGSWFKRSLHKMGFGEANKFALRRATVCHYEACTDRLNPDNFFINLKLPDTLYSFYLIAQLHVWMCQARSMKEGPEGRILRNEILERMWQDMDVRMSKLDIYVSSKRKALLQDLLYHHQGAIFSYDEGLLVDDKTLANALWRTLFSKEPVEPEILELAVQYVRTQMNHLKNIGPREWCLDGRFDWALFPPLMTEIKPSVVEV